MCFEFSWVLLGVFQSLFMRGTIHRTLPRRIEQDENSIIVMEKIRTVDTAEQRTLHAEQANHRDGKDTH